MGKTRLALAFAEEVAASHGLVLWGRASEEALVPFQPWIEALHDLVLGPDGPELLEKLGREAEHLLRLFDGGEPEGQVWAGDLAAHRYLMFEAVASLLGTAAQDLPVLLVMDDAQWADAASMRLLSHLADHPLTTRVMTLLIGRAGEEHEVEGFGVDLARLRRHGTCRRVDLHGLDQSSVHSIMAAIRGPEVARGLAASVHVKTGGNPFFVEQIARHLDETAGGEVVIPPMVRAALHQRLDRLSHDTHRLLEVAALVGQEFDLTLMAAVVDSADASRCAEEAMRAALLREAGGRYTFVHALIPEVLVTELEEGERAGIHERLGLALEAQWDGRDTRYVGQLAHHFLHSTGEHATKARLYSEAAGDSAMAALAFEEAGEHYRRALEMAAVTDPSDELGSCRLILKRAEALRCAYDIQASQAQLFEAARIALRAGAREELGRAVFTMVWLSEYRTHDATLAALLEEALLVADPDDHWLRARLLVGLARVLPARGRARQAQLCEEAMAAARSEGDLDTLGLVLDTVALLTWSPDNLEERLALAEEAAAIARQLDWDELLISACRTRASSRFEAGDLDGVEQDMRTCEELAQRRNLPAWSAGVALAKTAMALFRGDFAEAERLSPKVIEGVSEGPNFPLAYAVQQFYLQRERGHLTELEGLVRTAAASAPDLPAQRVCLAILEMELGRTDAARAQLEALAADGFTVLPKDWLWHGSMLELAWVCAGLGDQAIARCLYDLLSPYADRLGLLGFAIVALGSTHHHLGLLARTFGDFETAISHFRRARTANESAAARPARARTECELARTLLIRGDGEDAAEAFELLKGAAETGRELGMAPLVSAVDNLLASV